MELGRGFQEKGWLNRFLFETRNIWFLQLFSDQISFQFSSDLNFCFLLIKTPTFLLSRPGLSQISSHIFLPPFLYNNSSGLLRWAPINWHFERDKRAQKIPGTIDKRSKSEWYDKAGKEDKEKSQQQASIPNRSRVMNTGIIIRRDTNLSHLETINHSFPKQSLKFLIAKDFTFVTWIL